MNQLRTEIASFQDAAKGYETDAAKLELVTSTDKRLHQAKYILDNSFSVYSLLTAIENATINTAQLTALELNYTNEEEIEVSASVATESFDSALFQRSVFLSKSILESTDIEDVQIEPEEGGFIDINTPTITFVAAIKVDPQSIKTRVISDPAFIPTANTQPVEPEVGVDFANE